MSKKRPFTKEQEREIRRIANNAIFAKWLGGVIFLFFLFCLLVISSGQRFANLESHLTSDQIGELMGWEKVCVEYRWDPITDEEYKCVGRNFATTDCMSIEECGKGCDLNMACASDGWVWIPTRVPDECFMYGQANQIECINQLQGSKT